VVKKSAAAIASQCAARKLRHDVGRSGTGPIPSFRKIVAIVDRATRCPRFFRAPLNPRVAPRRILPRHAHPELADLPEHAGAPDGALGGGPFSRDQLTLPSQNRIRCHQRRHLRQDRSPQRVAPTRQTPALRVGQPQSASSDLRFENAVLLSQILNHSSWWRFTQPASATSRICQRTMSTIGNPSRRL
jgi:hypothetical protein